MKERNIYKLGEKNGEKGRTFLFLYFVWIPSSNLSILRDIKIVVHRRI